MAYDWPLSDLPLLATSSGQRAPYQMAGGELLSLISHVGGPSVFACAEASQSQARHATKNIVAYTQGECVGWRGSSSSPGPRTSLRTSLTNPALCVTFRPGLNLIITRLRGSNAGATGHGRGKVSRTLKSQSLAAIVLVALCCEMYGLMLPPNLTVL